MCPTLPPDPVCAICSKPILYGGFIRSDSGDFSHIRCRSQVLQLAALDQGDRARRAINRAADLVEETASRRRPRCPLCGAPATLTDWRPEFAWVGVEGCRCGGFFVASFVATGLLLRTLSPFERHMFSRKIQAHRAIGREVWLTTTDGSPTGALVARTERPDRAS